MQTLTDEIKNNFHQEDTKEAPTACEVIIHVAYKGTLSGLASTYVFGLAGVLWLISREHDPENPTLYSAAAPVIVAFLDTCVAITVSPSFAVGIVGSRTLGEIKSSIPDSQSWRQAVDKMSGMIKHGIFFTIPFMLGPAIVMIFSEDFLVTVCFQNKAVAHVAQKFLRPLAFTMPLYSARYCIEQVLFMMEYQLSTMVISQVSLLGLEIGLSYALSRSAGLDGIIGGIIADDFFSLLGLTSIFFLGKNFSNFEFLQNWCRPLNWPLLKELADEGGPISALVISEISSRLVKTLMFGGLGINQLAALNIITFFSLFISTFAWSFSQTVAYEIGQAVGGLRKLRTRMVINQRQVNYYHQYKNRYAHYGLLTLVLAISPWCLTILIKPIEVAGWRSEIDPEVANSLKMLFRLSVIDMSAYSIALMMLQSLRAVGKKSANWTFNATLWGGVLAGFFFAYPLKLGNDGIIWGSLTGNLLAIALFLKSYLQKFKSPPELSSPLSTVTTPLLLVEEETRVSSCWCSCFSRIKKCLWGETVRPKLSSSLEMS